MSGNCHTLTAEMCFSKNYEVMSNIGWEPNDSLNKSGSIQDWRSRCIRTENNLGLHIVADGNDIPPSGTILEELVVRDEGVEEVNGLFVMEFPILQPGQNFVHLHTDLNNQLHNTMRCKHCQSRDWSAFKFLTSGGVYYSGNEVWIFSM